MEKSSPNENPLNREKGGGGILRRNRGGIAFSEYTDIQRHTSNCEDIVYREK